MATSLRVVLIAALFSWALCGQQETGSITGQILDPSSAAVPNAQVTVKNESTGSSFSAESDAAGIYRAPQLAPGIYSITATAPGFNTLVRRGIEVRVNDRLRVDLALP